VSPLTSGRLSHSSGPLNGGGSLSDSPPVSPDVDDARVCISSSPPYHFFFYDELDSFLCDENCANVWLVLEWLYLRISVFNQYVVFVCMSWLLGVCYGLGSFLSLGIG
jgi:hypothetical protein